MAQLTSIVSFNDTEPAGKLAARLRENGIPAEVLDETGEQRWKLYNLHPRAHIRVSVHGPDAERAIALVCEWDAADGALAAAVRCPECRSTRVQYPQFSRRTIVGAMPAVLASAGMIEKEFYCEACHFTWPAEPPPTPDLDSLGWSRKKPVIKSLE